MVRIIIGTPTFLTETNKTYKTLYDFLTDTLEIEVIRPENLRNNFNENRTFLMNRDDEWLIKLYNMYASVLLDIFQNSVAVLTCLQPNL